MLSTESHTARPDPSAGEKSLFQRIAAGIDEVQGVHAKMEAEKKVHLTAEERAEILGYLGGSSALR